MFIYIKLNNNQKLYKILLSILSKLFTIKGFISNLTFDLKKI